MSRRYNAAAREALARIHEKHRLACLALVETKRRLWNEFYRDPPDDATLLREMEETNARFDAAFGRAPQQREDSAMIPVREFETAEELIAHNREVARKRFPAPPPTVPIERVRRPPPKALEPPPEPIVFTCMLAAGKQEARRIISEIALMHGVSVEDVTGPSRAHKYLAPRFEAMAAIVAANPSWSYNTVGSFFGSRDHACVINALNRLGVNAKRTNRTPPEMIALIIAAKRAGESTKQVIKRLPVSRTTVKNTWAAHLNQSKSGRLDEPDLRWRA